MKLRLKGDLLGCTLREGEASRFIKWFKRKFSSFEVYLDGKNGRCLVDDGVCRWAVLYGDTIVLDEQGVVVEVVHNLDDYEVVE